MVSAAHSAANRLNVQESAGLSDAQARRDAAEPMRGIRPQNSATPRPNRLGEVPQKIAKWESRADLSNEISERDVGGKPIPCSREPLW